MTLLLTNCAKYSVECSPVLFHDHILRKTLLQTLTMLFTRCLILKNNLESQFPYLKMEIIIFIFRILLKLCLNV